MTVSPIEAIAVDLVEGTVAEQLASGDPNRITNDCVSMSRRRFAGLTPEKWVDLNP